MRRFTASLSRRFTPALRTVPALLMLLIAPAALHAQNAPITGTGKVIASFSPAAPAVGANFDMLINVNLTGVTGTGAGGATVPAQLGSYTIKVTFDPAKVSYQSAAGSGAFSAPAVGTPSSNTLVLAASTASAVTGNTTVARLTFHSLVAGTAAFVLDPNFSPNGQLDTNIISGASPCPCGPTVIPSTGSSPTVTTAVAPSAPTGLNPADGATGVSTSATLSWNSSAGATSYDVYLGTSSSPGFLRNVSGTSTSASLVSGTTYRWKVVAKNSAGSAASAVQRFTTAGEPPCDALTRPSSVQVQSEGGTGVAYVVSWNSVTGATEYVVQESTDSTFATNTTSTTVSAPDTEATFSHSVDADTTYYYRVQARRVGGSCPGETSFTNAVSTVVHALPINRGFAIIVGSASGVGGSFFRTSAQLVNTTDSTITGTILYHPMGVSGASTDPSLPYVIPAGQAVAYNDIVETMGQHGLGTLELVSENPLPAAVFRVYNDGGSAGTTGFFEELFSPDEQLATDDSFVIVAPLDTAAARLNFGVLSGWNGATLEVTLRSKDGVGIKTLTKTYPPNFLEQKSDKQFLELENGVVSNDVITVRVTSGNAFVYGSLTDNKTQDPAMQVGRRSN